MVISAILLNDCLPLLGEGVKGEAKWKERLLGHVKESPRHLVNTTKDTGLLEVLPEVLIAT